MPLKDNDVRMFDHGGMTSIVLKSIMGWGVLRMKKWKEKYTKKYYSLKGIRCFEYEITDQNKIKWKKYKVLQNINNSLTDFWSVLKIFISKVTD